MMKGTEAAVEKVIRNALDLAGPGSKPARIPAPSSVAEWLDDMILLGHLYVGATRADHTDLCAHIQAERMAKQLLRRARAKAAASCQ